MEPASGRRILVVEDEFNIAMAMKLFLESHQCEVLGPAGRVPAAMDIASSEEIDAALLDINVRGHEVFPVADILMERGVPIIFLSGYEATELPERFRNCASICKPARPDVILAALDALAA